MTGKPNRITLSLDPRDLAFGLRTDLSYSMRDLLKALPGSAEDLLGWMPDVGLRSMEFAFHPSTQRFELNAGAGIGGGQAPSALLALVVGVGGVHKVELSFDTSIDLSGTPLLGALLEGLSIDDLSIGYEKLGRDGDTVAGAVTLGFTLRSGSSEETFRLSSGQTARLSHAGNGAEGGLFHPPVQWFPLQKKLGPLTIARIGIATPKDRFGIALDAALNLASLKLGLSGFYATFPTSNISPGGLGLGLDGMEVGFGGGSVAIAGSLRRSVRADYTEYAGSMSIRVGTFGIAAVGAFARVDGATSLFVFGLAEGSFGGPPEFFVTGLAAGFGFNRALKLPAIDAVQDYPLIMAAKQGGSYLPDPSPAAALAKMNEAGWVPPRSGSYWLAAGLRFSTYQVLDTFAMISVEFGQDLVLALLGISSVRLPKALPPASPPPAYLYAELTLSASIRPIDGVFALAAFLTPNSFVIDRNCRVRGGFAFYVWFGSNKHAGDLVLTLGGYSPHFARPLHYPDLPQVGFSWDVDQNVKIRGGCYLALTPSCIMAGGALSITFKAGKLEAWLDALADFVIRWNPFWFDARIGVTIGARYTLSLGLTRKTYSVALSASVDLWGPPLRGVARVNWWVISFTIRINGGDRPRQPSILPDWTAFADALLPSYADIVRVTAPSCLLRSYMAADADGAEAVIWVLDVAALRLGFASAVPVWSWRVRCGGDREAGPFYGFEAGVYPLGSVSLRSRVTLCLRRVGSSEPEDLSRWTWSPAISYVPEALWGTVNAGRPSLSATVLPAVLSATGEPSPVPPPGLPPVSEARLGITRLRARTLPLDARACRAPGAPIAWDDPRIVIAQTIMRRDVVEARGERIRAIERALPGARLPDEGLTRLRQDVWIAFPYPPMLPRDEPAPGLAREASSVGRRHAPPLPERSHPPQKPRLHAVYHRRLAPAQQSDWEMPSRARAFINDRFASRLESQIAHSAAETIAMGRGVVAAGSTLSFDLPRHAGSVLLTDGGSRIIVLAFDACGLLVQTVVLDQAGRTPVAEQASRLAVCAPSVTDDRIGWSGTSALLKLTPQALLGEGVVVRPQTPSPWRLARGADGVVSGAELCRDALHRAVPDRIDTVFLGPASDVRVRLRKIDARARIERVSLRAGTVRLRPRWESVIGDVHLLGVDLPANDSPTLTVAPSAGWMLDGVLAVSRTTRRDAARSWSASDDPRASRGCGIAFR